MLEPEDLWPLSSYQPPKPKVEPLSAFWPMHKRHLPCDKNDYRRPPKTDYDVRILLTSLLVAYEFEREELERNPEADRPLVYPEVVCILASTPLERVPNVRKWMEQFRLGLVGLDESVGYLRAIMQLERHTDE